MSQIQVVSAVDGFRRGGRAWSRTPTVVDTAELSAAQLEQLRAEPMLTVTEVAEAAEEGVPPGGGGRKRGAA